MLESDERQYWLWVTRPDYYWEDDGSDREILTLHVVRIPAVGGPAIKIPGRVT